MSDSQPASTSLLRKKSIAAMLGSGGAHAGGERLERSMSMFSLMMIGVGATIGTGIFFVMSVTVPEAGPGVLLTFLLVGVIVSLTALCYAEVASKIPVSGSGYAYSYASLGELPAYLVGWALILEYGVAGAATSVGWGEYFNSFINDAFGWTIPHNLNAGFLADDPGFINLPAVVLVGMCCLLLLRGAKESARANAIMVLIKLGVLAMFIIISFTAFDADNLSPFMPYGMAGVGAAVPAIFFTYIGIDAVSTAGEEVKDPNRSLPLAIFGAVGIVTLFYFLVAVGALGAQPLEKFDGQEAGLAAILTDITGNDAAALVLAAGAVVSIFSVTLITIYGQTRISFAMSRDGLIPKLFKEVDPRTLSPNKNVLFTCAFIAILAAIVPIDKLFDLVSIGTIAAFIVVSLTVPILRSTRPELAGTGFELPFGPVIPVLSVLACIWAAAQIAFVTWISVGLWIALALATYFFYSRSHSLLAPGNADREGAQS
jgi:basic amino acid/polyamine antiporter, APA family